MAPGVGALPPALGNAGDADGRVDVATTTQRFLSAVPPRSVRRIGLGLRALEWLSFPRRFSRASVEVRQELLARLEASSLQLVRDLVLYMKVLAGLGYANDARVRAAVGYEARCAVADGEPRPAPEEGGRGPLGDLAPPDEGEECDVAVVGSGAGGAVAATVLAEAGLEVVVLEAGCYLDRDSYPEEPIAALRALYRDGGLTVCEGRPAIPTPVGRAVGGTTVVNSGTCFRAPGDVLARWMAEHGIEWASDLDDEYEAAERMLAVAPVDLDRMGRNGQLLRRGAEALGVRHEPLRRNAGRCVQCSSCPQGCRLDAKRAMHVSYLPRAVAAGARVRAGVEVRRIEFRGARAQALACLASDSDPAANGRPPRPFTVRARRGIVLAGGAFGTPELLMRSGFRSPGGQLGHNLRIHPACWVGARFDEEVRGWDGVMQSYAVTEWEPRGLLLEATFTPLAFGVQWLPGTGLEHARRVLDYDHVASTGVHLSDRSSGRVRLAGDGALRLKYKLLRDDARRLAFGIARAAELFYAAGAVEVYPQIPGNPTIGRADIARLESSPPPAAALRLEAFHPMGTARIDADPARGAVAPDGSLHGAEGVWVADGSLLPSSIGVNPMMTIVAMASKVAQGIAARLA
jgi:choline dehydrogenase-like flavoprotein